MSPFAGIWVANISRSRRHPNHLFQSASLKFEIAGDEVSLTHEGVNMAGNHESGSVVLQADGIEREVSPQAPGVVVKTEWIGANTLKSKARKDGQTIGSGSYEITDDGTTMIATVSGTDASGATFDQVIVFERE